MKMHPVRYEFPLVLTLLADILDNPYFRILSTVPSIDPIYSKSYNRIHHNSIPFLLSHHFPDSLPQNSWESALSLSHP